MEKRLHLLIFTIMLVLGLAACGNDKSDDSTDSTSGNGTEVTTDEAEGADSNAEEEEAGNEAAAGRVLQNDKTIGLTMDEFKDKFNEQAAAQGLDYKIEEFEWVDHDDGTQTATIKLHDNLRLGGLATMDEDELKAFLLQVEGFEPRQTAFDLVNVIIKTVGNVTDDDAKLIMDGLGLKDPNEQGDYTETTFDHDGLKYLLLTDKSNSFELGIANKNDPNLIID
ncbi:hypothetical protein AB1K89_16075 [Sporosarcina sp. 179-K 8C2 HS]|uniref:hypothetical protein n=1 Tax=Sporosarcina sp. 179-K 8C2 HS TaxID=3142387 RepID=UPI0039A00BB3